MGSNSSKLGFKTPLGCVLSNWRELGYDQTEQRKQCLIQLSTKIWPCYALDNGSVWPPDGTFDFRILTDLTNFCQRTGKWPEIPYVQAFWYLCSRPQLCMTCSPTQILLAKTDPKASTPQVPDQRPVGNSPPAEPEDSALTIPPESLATPQVPQHVPAPSPTPAAPSPTPVCVESSSLSYAPASPHTTDPKPPLVSSPIAGRTRSNHPTLTATWTPP